MPVPLSPAIGFGHKRCGFAVGVRHVVDHVFVFLQLVGLFCQAVKNQAQLVLAGRHFVVVLVHFHAETLHGGEHFGTQVVGFVDRVDGEIAAFDARAVAHVAHFVFCVGVPGRIRRINFVGYFVDGVGIAHIVKQEEFSFRAHVGHITDACRLQVGFCFFGCAAWVTLVCFACVGLNNGAVHADRFFGVERVNISAVRIERSVSCRRLRWISSPRWRSRQT